ncbi:MAG: hypothetical protein M3Q00_02975 [Pseudomonadota bacterium]|nr:hypothetical protein [Pseudomonadota bacterium]
MRKTSAASLALLCIALALVGCASKPSTRAPRAPSEGRAPSMGDVQYDKFTGSCRSWENYIAQTGVQDCAGRLHPGWIGATRCTVTATGYKFTPKRDKGILGRTCFSVELPRNSNQFQVASACVRIVDWAPGTAVTQSCAEIRSYWLDQVLSHEQQHVYQCETEVWKANRRWAKQSRRYSACGFTDRGALRDLKDEINDAMNAETRIIMDTIERESERFHSTSQGQPLSTKCSLCK